MEVEKGLIFLNSMEAKDKFPKRVIKKRDVRANVEMALELGYLTKCKNNQDNETLYRITTKGQEYCRKPKL